MGENKYTPEWFKDRALSGLKKIGDEIWDYSDSLLLYTPGAESEYESIQQGNDPYAELITKPEREYLEKIAEQITEQLPENFEYIDLGPGTAHKEQFIFDAVKKAGKDFVYKPVDISERYLRLAKEYAILQGIKVNAIQSSFEELAIQLGNPSIPRFVSLGLTFTNYEPQEILDLLKNIAGASSFIFIDAQIRERVDMEKITKTYREDAKYLADPKIALLGLDPLTDILEKTTDDGVRMWYTLGKLTPELKTKGVNVGDKLLMFRSLRYTKEALEKEFIATNCQYNIFDTNDPFIGGVIKV